MEKLEKKIYEMVYQSGDEASENTASNLASEVKDIAIAFAEYYTQQTQINRIEAERIFSDFISNYYK